jgi:hypothetical protein
MRALWRIVAGFSFYAAAVFFGWHSLFLLLVGALGTGITYVALGPVERSIERHFGTIADVLGPKVRR